MTPAQPEDGFPVSFRVGEWLVEPSLDRVSCNGTVRRLRPQLTDLLVFLAQRAGRTVAKEEILASVWDGQFVAESGMTRCIAEIRQALGDDAREPRVIQTIPKRGYRLVAPVVFLGDPGSQGEKAPEQAPPGEGDGDTPPLADTQPAAAAMPTAARGWWRPDRRQVRWMRRTVLAALLVLALAWTTGGWSKSPALGERDTILLADVTNTTGDGAFDQTLRLALAVQLGQAPFLNILSTGHVRTALTLMGRSPDQALVGPVALEVCRREAAALLLQGSIARLGTHYAIGLEAVACASGESIARELEEVEGKDRVLSALGSLAVRLRRKLGESRESLRQYDVPIVQATTPSLDALKALSLGDLSRDRGLVADALNFYRRATDLDPQFALAWARRGAAAHNVGQCVNEERFGPADEPALAFRRAFELRDRVSEPERFYILAHYYRSVEGDPFKAVETYKMWRRLYPGSVVPAANLASIYIGPLGRYDAALVEAKEAVRLAPYSSIAKRSLIAAYLGTNRVSEARQVLRDMIDRDEADLLCRELAFQLAFADRDDAGMQAQAKWATGDTRASMILSQYRALAAASLGRLVEARRLWAEAAYAAEQAGSPTQRATLKAAEAETEALLGDPRLARAAAARALAIDRHPGTLLAAAIAYALSGEPARAERLVQEASSRTDVGICSRFAWRPVARALVDARMGRQEQGLMTVREAAPFERGRDFALGPMCVRAVLELSTGHSQDAVATFRDLLRLAPVVPTSPWVAYARLGLARALRDSGDAAASRAAYDAVIDGMPQADADAPLLAAARAERASLARP